MYFYFSKILAPFLNLTNLLFIFLIILILLNIKYLKKYKFLFKILLLFYVLLAVFPIGKVGLSYLEKDYFFQEKFNKVDNIIVLAGAENLVSTKTSKKLNLNDNSERLILSVKLALEHPNSKIYFVGGDGLLDKSEINEIFVAKLFYESVGFDINRVN